MRTKEILPLERLGDRKREAVRVQMEAVKARLRERVASSEVPVAVPLAGGNVAEAEGCQTLRMGSILSGHRVSGVSFSRRVKAALLELGPEVRDGYAVFTNDNFRPMDPIARA